MPVFPRAPFQSDAAYREVERVSIHAPAWGATLRPQWAVWRLKQFQSTPPRGGRQWEEYTRRSSTSVSIHAPAWGATPVPEIACDSEEFQSTPPRGGRPLPLRSGVNRVTSFNPRPRVGGDGAGEAAAASWPDEFQSTPPRGGRLRSNYRMMVIDSFQSTPPRGGRRRRGSPPAQPSCFNPRPRVGGDPAGRQ